MRTTHTYVLLEVSSEVYQEIRIKLRDAGYQHCLTEDGEIDMSGIAIITDESPKGGIKKPVEAI